MKILIINLCILIGILATIINVNKESLPERVSRHIVKLTDIMGQGTGFYLVYKGKTHLISNKHVCGNMPAMFNGVKHVRVLKISDKHDICLLESDRVGGLRLAEHDLVRFEEVHIVGHPIGYPLTYRVGTFVSEVIETFPWIGEFKVRALHLSLTIYGGNSGSPVFNSEGKVVALAFGGDTRTEHDSFAVPLRDIKIFLDEIRK